MLPDERYGHPETLRYGIERDIRRIFAELICFVVDVIAPLYAGKFQNIAACLYVRHCEIAHRETERRHGFVKIRLGDDGHQSGQLQHVVAVVQEDVPLQSLIAGAGVFKVHFYAVSPRDLIGTLVPKTHVGLHRLLLQIRHELLHRRVAVQYQIEVEIVRDVPGVFLPKDVSVPLQ